MSGTHNEYRCCIEKNQSGKYCVRIRAEFARHEWLLPLYFLASTFDRSIRKLEQALQLLQRDEDRLWFWGMERSGDHQRSEEMWSEVGLHVDRRAEFPRRAQTVEVPPEQAVPAFLLGPVRRGLAASVDSSRSVITDR